MSITERRKRTVRLLALLPLFMLLLSATWILPDYRLGILSSALYLSVAVLSMNVLVGFTGQISIGNGAFLGIGAYTVAILVSDHDWPYWAATIAAIALTAAVGAITSIPALRLRGLYVALTSLGVALVFPTVLQRFASFTGGEGGTSVLKPLEPPAGLDVTRGQWSYVVLLILTVLALLLILNLKFSRVGRAMMAIRDQDLVAQSFGINLTRTKIAAFSVSAGLAGLAGAMFTIQNQFVSPADFGLTTSINLLVGMAIGGPTSVLGALVGGAFLQYVPPFTRSVGVPALLTPGIYGLILIAFAIFFRDGIVQGAGAIIRRLRPAPRRNPQLHVRASAGEGTEQPMSQVPAPGS